MQVNGVHMAVQIGWRTCFFLYKKMDGFYALGEERYLQVATVMDSIQDKSLRIVLNDSHNQEMFIYLPYMTSVECAKLLKVWHLRKIPRWTHFQDVRSHWSSH